jgi:RNA polymerase sigma-B factor
MFARGKQGHNAAEQRALQGGHPAVTETESTPLPASLPPRQPAPAIRPPDDLVVGHIGLARSLARRFANRGESYDDLVQVALLGLVKAASRFDAARGVQFSTFATTAVTGELKRHFRDKRWAMRVPRSLQERYLHVRAATDDLVQTLGRSPTVAEVAERVGLPMDAVVEAQEVGTSFQLASIEAGPGAGEGTMASRGDVPSPDGERVARIDDRSVLVPLLRRLPLRQQEVMALRFGENLTQSQIAMRVGMSQMQVSRLISRSLADLRRWLMRDAEQESQAGSRRITAPRDARRSAM